MLDYVDLDDVKEDIKDEVINQIKLQIKALVEEQKSNIQEQFISKLVKEVISNAELTQSLKDLIYTKAIQCINNRYDPKDDFHLCYDLGLPDILKDVYKDNQEHFDHILYDKTNNMIKNYNVDTFIFSNRLSQMLIEDTKYQDALKDFLDTKLYEILDKI